MKYLCIKSVSIGEKDTSPLTTEVFTKDLEYECVNGFLIDNIGVKRSIDKPHFTQHFERISEVVNSVNIINEQFLEIIKNYNWSTPVTMGKSVNEVFCELMQQAYELGQKQHIEMYKWLLGYYDFPDKPIDGRAAYWWRSHLKEKLKEIGIEIESPEPFIKKS